MRHEQLQYKRLSLFTLCCVSSSFFTDLATLPKWKKAWPIEYRTMHLPLIDKEPVDKCNHILKATPRNVFAIKQNILR